MTEPVPERGYCLPGNTLLVHTVHCLFWQTTVCSEASSYSTHKLTADVMSPQEWPSSPDMFGILLVLEIVPGSAEPHDPCSGSDGTPGLSAAAVPHSCVAQALLLHPLCVPSPLHDTANTLQIPTYSTRSSLSLRNHLLRKELERQCRPTSAVSLVQVPLGWLAVPDHLALPLSSCGTSAVPGCSVQ